MEYERLVKLARAAAAMAAEARTLGQDNVAWNLVQAGDELERAAILVRPLGSAEEPDLELEVEA